MEASKRPRVHPMEIVAVAVALACAAVIGLVQPGLSRSTFKVKQEDDTNALPPPSRLKALAFGYRAAAADLLWASLLVEHGLHSTDHRRFPGAESYVRGIIELDPEHPLVYQFVDTLLVLAKPGAKTTADDARIAKEIMKRGTEARPYDHEVWLHYGQYLAFLAPSVLTEKDEQDAWRTEGAYALARAVELGANPDRSLAASTLLSKAGEKKAAIRQLQRAYAIADNPDTRQQISLKLERLEASPEAEEVVQRFEAEWHSRYGFLSRTAALLIGPHRPPATCAGLQSYGHTKCPPDWVSATGDDR